MITFVTETLPAQHLAQLYRCRAISNVSARFATNTAFFLFWMKSFAVLAYGADGVGVAMSSFIGKHVAEIVTGVKVDLGLINCPA